MNEVTYRAQGGGHMMVRVVGVIRIVGNIREVPYVGGVNASRRSPFPCHTGHRPSARVASRSLWT